MVKRATYTPVVICFLILMVCFWGCDLYSGATYTLANTVLEEKNEKLDSFRIFIRFLASPPV